MDSIDKLYAKLITLDANYSNKQDSDEFRTGLRDDEGFEFSTLNWVKGKDAAWYNQWENEYESDKQSWTKSAQQPEEEVVEEDEWEPTGGNVNGEWKIEEYYE